MAYDRAALEDALRNAHRAGDTAAATKLANALAGMQAPAGPSAEAVAGDRVMADRAAKAATYAQERTSNPFLTGVDVAVKRGLKGVLDLPTLVGGPSLAPERLNTGLEQAQAAAREKDSGWTTAGEVAGELGMGLLPGAAIAKGARAVQGLGRAAPAVADILGNAAYSAATAIEDRGTAGALGGAGAAGGRLLAKALGRVAKPVGEVGPEGQRLQRAGVEPTFGQLMSEPAAGSNKPRVLARALARSEEIAQSVPFGGSVIRNARDKALEQWQGATRTAALPDDWAQAAYAAKAAPNSVADVDAAIKRSYASVLKDIDMPAVEFNPMESLTKAASGDVLVTPKQMKAARSVLKDRFERPPTSAVEAQQLESRLKTMAFNYKASPDPSQRDFGNLLHSVANDWRDAWRGALPAHVTPKLAEVDEAFQHFVPIRRAAATGNVAAPDQYTPRQLLQAIRAGDKSSTKSRFVRGQMPQQELAQAGQMLTSKVNDSGTPERAFALGLPLAGALNPAALLSIPAAGLYGTRGVQNYLTGRMAPRAQQAGYRAAQGAKGKAAQIARASTMAQYAKEQRAREEQAQMERIRQLLEQEQEAIQ